MPSSDLLDETALPGAFALFQRFNRREDMEEVISVLQEHGISVRTSDEVKEGWREAVIMGNPLEPQFWIEIPANRFEQANFLLQEAAEAEIGEEDLAAHPFADYATEELQQVLLEETEWSPEAVVVARRLLLQRDENVDLAALRQASRERVRTEFIPQKGHILSMLLTTLVGVFSGVTLWFIGIMFCLGILLYYRVGTRRDPKGAKHWAYTAGSRQWALGGLLVMTAAVVLGFVNFFFLHWGFIAEVDGWLWWWR